MPFGLASCTRGPPLSWSWPAHHVPRLPQSLHPPFSHYLASPARLALAQSIATGPSCGPPRSPAHTVTAAPSPHAAYCRCLTVHRCHPCACQTTGAFTWSPPPPCTDRCWAAHVLCPRTHGLLVPTWARHHWHAMRHSNLKIFFYKNCH